jgi:branched-chain amino acid transport system ATP-binding protein
MLTVRGLRVSYGGAILALRQISLEVPRGAVVAVLGSNGAGKTTLLRAISGVLAEHGGTVDAGSIEFEGRSLVGRSPAAIVTAGIVQAPEGRRIFERLTVTENLRIGGFSVRQAAARTRALLQVYDLFPILYDRRGARAGLLSGGQQQMLALGRVLAAEPRVLLADELSLGLAPMVVERLLAAVRAAADAGVAVILVEQHVRQALAVADRVHVLRRGRVVLSGDADDLRGDAERIAAHYLTGEA